MATKQPPRPGPSFQDVRDAVLFFCGLALTIHEALEQTNDRPDLLILYAAMMGLPAYLMGERNKK